MKTKIVLRSWFGIGTCLCLFLTIPAADSEWRPHEAFGLGSASDFAVLSLGKPTAETDGQSKLDLSAATVYGDVGVGPYGTLDFQGPSTIEGDLYIDSTLLPQDIISDAGTVTGVRSTADLSAAVGDALAAADTNAARMPTQSFDRLSASTTLYGKGGLNVIAIEGLDYSRSSTTTPLQLTLMGGEDDLFVLNVSGKFVLGPNSSIRGVDPSRVLINVLQGNTPVQFAANSYVGGTLLSTERKMGPLQGASGPVIGARVAEISLVGGAALNPPPMAPLAIIVADHTVSTGAPAQLDGSASTAPYGDPLSYLWEFDSPVGSSAELSDDSAVAPFFIPDLPGEYVVQLVVCDGDLFSEPAVAVITASEPGEGVDLSLAITDDPDPVVRKQLLTYTLTITNQSPDTASEVRLVVDLSGDVKGTPVVEPAELCGASDAGISCSLVDSLGGNTSMQVNLSVIPKRPGLFTVETTVSAGGEDPDPGDNTVVEETTVLR